ncbi:MAG: hypothetical protein M3364_02105 [Actinomycetota bacterium]|nr:hypothetical protein [Actinomycetota bacterium]
MSGLLLRDVRPSGATPIDVLVADGRVERVEAKIEVPQDVETFDGRGELLLPGLVDAHAHLDKTLWGLPWRPHSAGPGRAGLIENERANRTALPPVAERAEALLREYVSHGTTAIRSHVDGART